MSDPGKTSSSESSGGGPGPEGQRPLMSSQHRRERKNRFEAKTGGQPMNPGPFAGPAHGGLRGRRRGNRGGGTVTHHGSGSSGRSSGWSCHTQKSTRVVKKYATRWPALGAEYPQSWPLPTDEESRTYFTKMDIPKMLRSRIICKFTGHVGDYARFKASFFQIIHVQREPARIKAAALDSLIEPKVRERVFGTRLSNSELDYVERLERLESKFGGDERVVVYSLNKINALKEQSRKNYEKFSELVDTIYFFIKEVGESDADSLILRDHLREGTPPSLLKRYFEETEGRGHKDTLSHMLEWARCILKVHFRLREFEEML